ncbi:MAG TPA: sigma-54 dependent transcriptional regulator [Gemmataceae bacterium]|jgi:DNA-binding NtrC family response regulator|nr:sigma-54 dependent transcriptional regulator [Gemmataceae bacterium]
MPSSRAAVLVCDDEPLIRETLAEFLASEGFAVEAVGTGEDAAKRAAARFFDVVLCDVNLPGIDGIETLQRVLAASPESFVLLITAYGTVESAVEAFQRGAQDYLMKPILLDEVLGKIRRLLKLRDLSRENQWLRRELHQKTEKAAVIGESAAMTRLYELAARVGPTRSTVLVQGESGTGKEVLARFIHEKSGGERFVAVNCAAIPNDLLENQLFGHRKGAFTGADRDSTGVFVHAGDGTVFLDEIAELPLATQAKLLRTIEQKEVHPVGANEPVKVEARIIAATNKGLAAEVEAGRFREDLFYRLNVVALTLPPLRDRREDIPELVEFLLAKQAKALNKRIAGVSHEAMQLLIACPWKGNVRELDNALQRAVILGDGPLVTPADLPPDLAPVADDPGLVDDLTQATKRFERRHIERILRQTADKKEASKRLGIGLSSLYRKIDELNVLVPETK